LKKVMAKTKGAANLPHKILKFEK